MTNVHAIGVGMSVTGKKQKNIQKVKGESYILLSANLSYVMQCVLRSEWEK